ncbi:MAG: GNAT family N-acetyltransferase [Acidimicrobiia bacterium]|nr:GNAT family N-acetyltransferase [Acidimicrobiia bacterium]
MSPSPDWGTASFDLPPIAPAVGPFPSRDWLRAWWEERGTGELHIADSGDSLLALTVIENVVEFAGEPDLTDYHSPLGASDVNALSSFTATLPEDTAIRLDSLPEPAADAVAGALAATGPAPIVSEHEVAAVLDLPDDYSDYLNSLDKKERHEVRRKRRRFENERGSASIERRHGDAAVALFADLHRRAAGVKGSFMTPDIEAFFQTLHTSAGGVVDVLLDGSGLPAAAVFCFEDEHTTYLYNSAFEPELRHLSPGNVMLSLLIEKAIAEGRRTFDFLKGDERYKFRLGAKPRRLFEVTVLPEGSS